MEFNKSAFMCFVDLTQTFDRVRLRDMLNILHEKRIDPKITTLIKKVNTHNTIKIRIGKNL